MSKSLRKRKNHWTSRVHESVLGRTEEGSPGLELRGGAENGRFPLLGGQLSPDELLLEVNDTPVAGLTTRDVHAVVRHSKVPVRLKSVKPGEDAPIQNGFLRFCSGSFFALISEPQLSWDTFVSPQADSVLCCGQTFPLKPNLSRWFCKFLRSLRNFDGAAAASGVWGVLGVLLVLGGPVAMRGCVPVGLA